MLTSKELIESGMLELYVLGRLSEKEKAEVEYLCRQFEEVRTELREIELAMEAVDSRLAKAPSLASKQRLFNGITGEQPVINPSLPSPANSGNSWMLAASVSVAVISLAAAIFFYQKWSTASQQYEDLIAQNSVLATELNQVKNALEQNESLLAVTTDATSQRIVMSAAEVGSDLKVLVYWNATSNEVYLDTGNLPLPGDQQDYQLWAIVDGKPVDMGVIALGDAGGLLKMNPVANAAAFAITIEPKGGKPQPTLENMLVVGNASV